MDDAFEEVAIEVRWKGCPLSVLHEKFCEVSPVRDWMLHGMLGQTPAHVLICCRAHRSAKCSQQITKARDACSVARKEIGDLECGSGSNLFFIVPYQSEAMHGLGFSLELVFCWSSQQTAEEPDGKIHTLKHAKSTSFE